LLLLRFFAFRVGFVFTFLPLRWALGLFAVAVVSLFFLVSRLVLGLLLCVGFVFLFSYSSVSYSDHSFKLTMF